MPYELWKCKKMFLLEGTGGKNAEGRQNLGKMRKVGDFFKNFKIFLHFQDLCLIYYLTCAIIRTAFTKGKNHVPCVSMARCIAGNRRERRFGGAEKITV